MDYARIFAQLRQRKLVQTIIVYLGGSWGILQALSLFQSTYAWPRVVMDVGLFVLGCGLVAAATIAWFHGERGHQRVTRSELLILATVAISAIAGGWGLATRPTNDAPPDPSAAPAGLTMVVMPFVNTTRDSSLVWLQKGVAEMLTTDLAEVPRLHVVSGERVFDLLRQQGAGNAAIVAGAVAEKVARQASAGYIVRGAVFRSASTLRLDAELVRVSDGQVAASAQAVGPDVFTLVDTLAGRLADRVLVALAPTGTPVAPPEPPAPLSRVATGNVEAYREYHAGLEAERELQERTALQHYERALALDSTFPQALLRLGRLELYTGDYADARLHLDQAQAQLGQAPERERRFAGALVAATRQDRAAAAAALERLTSRYPDDKAAWFWLARAYAAEPGKGADRERALRQALRLDPTYAPAVGELAYEFARRGDFAAADSFAAEYTRLDPGEPEPLDARGQIQEAAGRSADARQSYVSALRARADFVDALAHLVRLGMRSGQVEQAAADVAPYLRSADPAVRLRARMLTGDLLLWRGRVDEALAAAEQARRESVGLDPHWRDVALRGLLELWQLLGEDQRIVQTLDSLPGGPDDRFMLEYAAALGELGRVSQIQALEQRVRLPGPRAVPPGASGPGPARATYLAQELAAYAAYYRGDWPGAVRAFRAARAVRPGPAGEAVDPREVLALLNAHRAGEALPLVQPFDSAAFGRPIVRRVDLYLEARVYEATGRSAAASRVYALLLQDWQGCIGRFRWLRDAPQRAAALARRSR